MNFTKFSYNWRVRGKSHDYVRANETERSEQREVMSATEEKKDAQDAHWKRSNIRVFFCRDAPNFFSKTVITAPVFRFRRCSTVNPAISWLNVFFFFPLPPPFGVYWFSVASAVIQNTCINIIELDIMDSRDHRRREKRNLDDAFIAPVRHRRHQGWKETNHLSTQIRFFFRQSEREIYFWLMLEDYD